MIPRLKAPIFQSQEINYNTASSYKNYVNNDTYVIPNSRLENLESIRSHLQHFQNFRPGDT